MTLNNYDDWIRDFLWSKEGDTTEEPTQEVEATTEEDVFDDWNAWGGTIYVDDSVWDEICEFLDWDKHPPEFDYSYRRPGWPRLS